MRVLVTGAGGFIGSHVVSACLARGYDVRAFVHYNSVGRRGWLAPDVVSQLDVHAGDVRDYDSVRAAARGVDVIYHLAALIGIPYSYESPLAYVRTNVEGTYNVLQAGRQEGVQQVLVTSTSETYGTAQYAPIDEKHPAVGQSPYAATKIGADQLALSYYRSFGLPVKVVRPFNTYGPRQSARAIIPSVLSQLLAGESVLRVGNLEPTRDLTFVTDTAAGFLAIADSDALIGDPVNIGNGKEISIGDLIQLMVEVTNSNAEIQQDPARIRPGKSEVERLICDNSKLREATDWRPQVDIRSGLERTATWLREFGHLYRPHEYAV